MHGFPGAGPARPRGYVLTYRPGQPNVCPGCGGQHWHVGRQTAECAYCLTALPLADPAMRRSWLPSFRRPVPEMA